MYHETEVQSNEIIIMQYELSVFDKDNGKILLVRLIAEEELAIKLYEEQVKIYHNIPKRAIIKLYDIEKCTNIRYYDTDDNI